MQLIGAEAGQQTDDASTRRSSLVGAALVPSLGHTASELAKERSFCNPEDTEEAAAIGRQASGTPLHDLGCVGSIWFDAGAVVAPRLC